MKALDLMGFAGSMAAGVDQAGFDIVAKREPSKFGGFGVNSLTYNMPWVEAQVAEPAAWDLPAERDIDLVYGCPPCSGFSQLSAMNTVIYKDTGTTYRGADAEINECMDWFVTYAARVRPRVVVMESVGPAFKLGREWMESLWQKLRSESGLPYELTHVNMNASLVGGDVVRPRYFLVAHLQPFGVGLEFVEPRTMSEVLADLGPTDSLDHDWGHHTRETSGTDRMTLTINWLREQGLDWAQGTRLPTNTEGLEPPEFWRKAKPSTHPSKRGYPDDVYSHWYSTDAFSPLRWRGDKPFGVIVAASLDRAIHPTEPRTLTFREAARLMSIPDTWSMRVLVEQNRPAELGKAVPSASAKWIAHWAKMSIEGTPGEYAGREDGTPGVRVIQVQQRKQVDSILQDPTGDDVFWAGGYSDPDPSTWLIDRKARPAAWWQREDELGIFLPKNLAAEKRRPPQDRAGRSRVEGKARVASQRAPIERVSPAVMSALIASLGMTNAEAAVKLGVSVSRVKELTSDGRPDSWLNASRLPEVEEALRA